MPSLYVTEPGAMLSTEAGRLIVSKGDELLLSVPAGRVSQVVMVGGAGITTPTLGMLLDRRVPVVFLTAQGAFRGRLSGDLSRNLDLRRRQRAEAGERLHHGVSFIASCFR